MLKVRPVIVVRIVCENVHSVQNVDVGKELQVQTFFLPHPHTLSRDALVSPPFDVPSFLPSSTLGVLVALGYTRNNHYSFCTRSLALSAYVLYTQVFLARGLLLVATLHGNDDDGSPKSKKVPELTKSVCE